MGTRADFIQLISILEEEGFGFLAGEVLSEISRGREVEKRVVHAGQSADLIETTIQRVPYDESDQLLEATALVRLYLVQPFLAFAEAETIAGKIANREDLRIQFVDPADGTAMAPLSSVKPGDRQAVQALDRVLEELPSKLETPPAKI